eukprot:3918267-Lingulodinium_polyedra.AAC.1
MTANVLVAPEEEESASARRARAFCACSMYAVTRLCLALALRPRGGRKGDGWRATVLPRPGDSQTGRLQLPSSGS